MRYIKQLKEQYGILERSLKNYLADYDHHNDDWRMTEISWQLDLLRNIRYAFMNIVYPELASSSDREVQPLLAAAKSEQDALEMRLETIINVHVDEPFHEYKEKIEKLLVIIEKLHRLDSSLLEYFNQNAPDDRVQMIDHTIHKKIFPQLVASGPNL